MNEILKMLNALTADELDSVIMRASIMLEKKRKDEAEEALREKERQRQEKIAQEKRRLEEIAELQRKLQELQNQKIIIPDAADEVKGDNFVMYDTADAAKEKPEPEQQSVQLISCPHCHLMNVAGSQFCANCGQRMTSKTQPAAQPQAAPSSAPAPAAQPQAAPSPAPAPAAQPQASVAQVRYADESMKNWERLPGEKTERSNHDIILLQPYGGKYAYYMEVTNQRILLMRESTGSKKASVMARMGGGLVGSLIAESVKAATGAGPKAWLEIPLTAVSNCGLQNKKEFFIVADQTYVLKNKNYEKFLPELVANAKRSGF